MKTLLIILGTFALAFVTSLLLEWPLVAQNMVRYILVVLLMACELIVGGMVLVGVLKNGKPEN